MLATSTSLWSDTHNIQLQTSSDAVSNGCTYESMPVSKYTPVGKSSSRSAEADNTCFTNIDRTYISARRKKPGSALKDRLKYHATICSLERCSLEDLDNFSTPPLLSNGTYANCANTPVRIVLFCGILCWPDCLHEKHLVDSCFWSWLHWP